MNTILTSPRKSKAGNLCFDALVDAKEIIVTVNSRWNEENKKTQPSFILQAKDDKGTVQYSGKGAAWCMTRKEGRVHQGNIIINDETFLVDIRRITGTTNFELQLTPQTEIPLDNL